MTTRDRTVLMVLGVVALVAGFYFLALKPKRADIKALDAKVTAAQLRVDTASTAVAAGEKAKKSYSADYAAVAKLGKAVPTDDDTASLVFQLERAADRARVDFRSIELASNGGIAAPAPAASPTGAQVAAVAKEEGKSAPATPAPATQTAAAELPPGATVGPAGFPTMPFDFRFNGRFFRLETFLEELDRMVSVNKKGSLSVRGRLLTVDGFSLSGGPAMSASIHATSYLLPADQGLTNGATPSSPAAVGNTTTTSGSAPTPVATAGVGR